MNNVYQEELEALTGKVFTGDMSPIVFDLLSPTHNLASLYNYLTGVKLQNDNVNNTRDTLREESNNRPSFEKWFRKCERL